MARYGNGFSRYGGSQYKGGKGYKAQQYKGSQYKGGKGNYGGKKGFKGGKGSKGLGYQNFRNKVSFDNNCYGKK